MHLESLCQISVAVTQLPAEPPLPPTWWQDWWHTPWACVEFSGRVVATGNGQELVQLLQRELTADVPGVDYSDAFPEEAIVPFVGNGQALTESCLLNGPITDADGNYICPEEAQGL